MFNNSDLNIVFKNLYINVIFYLKLVLKYNL